jgi:hypothetical protein
MVGGVAVELRLAINLRCPLGFIDLYAMLGPADIEPTRSRILGL